jgi:hypothetical protein
MNRGEFESLRDLPRKAITVDIRFLESAGSLPNLVFDNVAVENSLGYDIVLNGTFKPRLKAVTHSSWIHGMTCVDLAKAIANYSLVVNCDSIDQSLLRAATPFRYPDGSNIDVFFSYDAQALPGATVLTVTDFGQTIAHLLDMHIKTWATKKRKQLVNDVCGTLGVTQRNGEFLVEVENTNEIPDAIVRVCQACIRVSDLVFTQRLSPPVSFRDDIEEFFSASEIAYDPDVLLPGKFNRNVAVDFAVHGKRVETLILALATENAASSHPLSNEAFRKWHDLEQHRTKYQFLTIYDSRTNVFRDDDIARLGDVSTVMAYPAQAGDIRAATAA